MRDASFHSIGSEDRAAVAAMHALVGDSAGGGLALALVARADRPVGAVALSPVTDLALSGESWTSRADAEFFFTKPQAESLVAAYVGPNESRDPRASPLRSLCRTRQRRWRRRASRYLGASDNCTQPTRR